ncbi:MAG: hypothetical protein ABR601_02100 [Parasphingopyxis sp.]
MVSIWHGTADIVVSPCNSDGIARQWKEVHRISGAPDEDGLVEGIRTEPGESISPWIWG